MTTPQISVQDCQCCFRPTTQYICFQCRIVHGQRVAKGCPVYAREERDMAKRIAAMPPPEPVVVSKEMQQRLWSLDR